MSTSTDVALMLLQLFALTIPPVVVLVDLLKRSENLEWGYRKLSFGLVFSSVLLLVGGSLTVLTYFVVSVQLSGILYAALLLAIAGLVPLCLFVGILYREHRKEFGP